MPLSLSRPTQRIPFDNISEDELAEYKRIIDAKARGDVTDSSLADGGPNSAFEGDHTFNGEETDGNRTFSEGEGDTTKATDTEMASPRKEKKKKSGLRTPSFLKKKKKDKKKRKVKQKLGLQECNARGQKLQNFKKRKKQE